MSDLLEKLERIQTLQFSARREAASENARLRRARMMEELSARHLTGGAVVSGYREILTTEFRKVVDGTVQDLLGLLDDLPLGDRLTHLDWARSNYETQVRGILQGFEGLMAAEYQQHSIRHEGRTFEGEYLRGKRALEVALGKIELRARARASGTGMPADVPKSTALDIFISHASEDKAAVARPLTKALQQRGFTVWLDEQEILLGDDIVGRVQEGLVQSRFAVVILSPAFFAKPWPMQELNSLIAIGLAERRVTVLPIVHDMSYDEARSKFPLLAATQSYNFSQGLDGAVDAIRKVLERSGGMSDRTAVSDASFRAGNTSVLGSGRVGNGPRIRIEVGRGTARMGDGRNLPSADIVLNNTGAAFTLVAHARLLDVTQGYEWEGDRWEYEPREVIGGEAKSWFHIATLGDTATAFGQKWLVKLRGERMLALRRWEGRGDLVFDVEWKLFALSNSMLTRLATVTARVALLNDERAFSVSIVADDIDDAVRG